MFSLYFNICLFWPRQENLNSQPGNAWMLTQASQKASATEVKIAYVMLELKE